MPNGGLNVGRDITLSIVTQDGPLVIPPNFITKFEAKDDAEIKKYLPITGIVTPVVFHMGWSGTIEVTRHDDSIDAYWALLEADYFNGVNIQGSTITETIEEASGSVTQYIYSNVAFKLETPGTWAGNEFVTQTLAFMAARKQRQI